MHLINSLIQLVKPALLTTLTWLVLTPAVTATAAVPPPPEIAARAYILVDAHTGAVLAQNQSTARMEPASLTKIMTSYVVFRELKAGKIHMDDNVPISEKAWRSEGSRTFVEVGNTVPLEVLLKGMVIQSGNDATIALAEHIAGSEEVFASMMNQVAQQLGMRGSHFVNSTGLPDPNHYTTAQDMAILSRALIRDAPQHYKYYAMREYTYNGITQHNRNLLLWSNNAVDGIKTGHTESAGYCLVASAVQNGMRLISVVLGTESEKARALETNKLLGYGFRFFETRRLYSAGKPLLKARVWKGEADNVTLGVKNDIHVTLPRGQHDKLGIATQLTDNIVAPVAKGAVLGKLVVTAGNRKVAEQSLVALTPVAEGGLFRRLIDSVKLMIN